MSLNRYANRVILVLRILANILLAFNTYLVANHVKSRLICPSIWDIPACFIIEFLAVAMLAFAILGGSQPWQMVFCIFPFIGLCMSLYFSVNEILHGYVCPRLWNIPLCFGAFTLFSTYSFLMVTLFISRIKEHLGDSED